MKVSRRDLLAGAAASQLMPAAAAPALGASDASTIALPAKGLFARMPFTYLDAGSTHPMSLGAKAALEEYLRFKTHDGPTPGYSMSARRRP